MNAVMFLSFPSHAFAQACDMRDVMKPVPRISWKKSFDRDDATAVGNKAAPPSFIGWRAIFRALHGKLRVNETAPPLIFVERTQQPRPKLVQSLKHLQRCFDGSSQ